MIKTSIRKTIKTSIWKTKTIKNNNNNNEGEDDKNDKKQVIGR